MSVKRYILPILLLFSAVAYDMVTSSHWMHEHLPAELEQVVNEQLDQTTKLLLSPNSSTILAKEELSRHELNNIKQLLDKLKRQDTYVKVFKNDELYFWTETMETEGFCRTFRATPFHGEVCYAPFGPNGIVKTEQLALNGYDHFFRIDHSSSHSIEGLPISMGQKYRTNNTEYFLLGLYLIGFLWLLGLSLKYKNAWPLLLLIGFRALSYILHRFEQFSIPELSESYFSQFSYSSIDLVFDSLLVFGVVLFLSDLINSINQKLSKLELTGTAFLHMLMFISHIRMVQLLMNSDRISVNLADLSQMKSIDILLFSMMVLTLLAIFHLGNTLFSYYKTVSSSKRDTYLGYAVSILMAVSISYGLKLDLDPLILMLFLVAYMTLLDLYVDVKNKTITWAIWWGIFFAIYLSALLFNYDIKKEVAQRQAYLEQAFHNIPSTKIKATRRSGLISEIGDTISKLLVLPDGAVYDKGDLLAFVKQTFKQTNIQLEVYDQDGQSVFDKSTFSTGPLSKILAIDSLTYFDELKNVVWYKSQLRNNQQALIGIEEINEEPTKRAFSYNYYRNSLPVDLQENLTKKELKLIKAQNSGVFYNGADAYVIYKPSKGRLLVSKKSFLGLIKPIALFAFLFSIIALWIIFLGVTHVIFKVLPKDWPLTIQNIESLNSKIQISLILVILLSFLIIATITSSFLKDYITKENEMALYEKLENLSKDFVIRTDNAESTNETVEIISNYKENIQEIHNISLGVYDLHNDNLNLDYFTSVYFTKQTDPFAFSYGETDKPDQSYVPIRYKAALAGIASVQLKGKANTETLNVFDFLGSIFNVYVFLFLIASVLSILIAQSITRPLSLLNQNLTQVSLNKANKQIEWTRDDEIGILIGNYNKMVNKLEESAGLLAKKERDSAWREMAKQVAHEIKNPLTPMRLSIQYLETAIKRDPTKALPIAKRISQTMLEQIDNLTGIAEAFGNFAQLPQSSNVKIELNNVVELVHNLFRKREDMDIKLAVPIDPISVYADKSQLVRILNNLVKNAIEAIPKERRGLIKVSLYTKNDKAIIQVQDNGDGIPNEMKEKVFQPKFTTKDSGSGLGLAISANMIDSMNGRLYFESEPGQPTSFFIELDIIRQPIYADKAERITLD